MSLAPLLEAPGTIPLHAFAAMAAFVLGNGLRGIAGVSREGAFQALKAGTGTPCPASPTGRKPPHA